MPRSNSIICARISPLLIFVAIGKSNPHRNTSKTSSCRSLKGDPTGGLSDDGYQIYGRVAQLRVPKTQSKRACRVHSHHPVRQRIHGGGLSLPLEGHEKHTHRRALVEINRQGETRPWKQWYPPA